jgi:glycosyltransferase involved in cell wall biosynthesis
MSDTHLVLIPSYNTGVRLEGTVLDALKHWDSVWVVVDGSDDGSDLVLNELCEVHAGLRVIRKSENGGKGSAVLHAAEMALESGFTHALVMDADGQHPGDSIESLIQISRQDANTVVMGQPVFGPEVPKARLYGRRLTIFWTELETLYAGLGDTLFGMRVYPLKPLCKVMHSTGFARGYDFDPEVAVRLVWEGVRPVQLPVPVRYFTKAEDGVSHFHYIRDNVKLTALHFRLMFLFLWFGAYRVLRSKKIWSRTPVSSTQS